MDSVISDRGGNAILKSETARKSDITPTPMSDARHALTFVVVAVYMSNSASSRSVTLRKQRPSNSTENLAFHRRILKLHDATA